MTVGELRALIILIPGLATLWMTSQKLAQPAPLPVSATGAGALAPGEFRLRAAARPRQASRRNDVLANVAIGRRLSRYGR